MQSNPDLHFACLLKRKWSMLRRECTELSKWMTQTDAFKQLTAEQLKQRDEHLQSTTQKISDCYQDLILALQKHPQTKSHLTSDKPTLEELGRICLKAMSQSVAETFHAETEANEQNSDSTEDLVDENELNELLESVNEIRTELHDSSQELFEDELTDYQEKLDLAKQTLILSTATLKAEQQRTLRNSLEDSAGSQSTPAQSSGSLNSGSIPSKPIAQSASGNSHSASTNSGAAEFSTGPISDLGSNSPSWPEADHSADNSDHSKSYLQALAQQALQQPVEQRESLLQEMVRLLLVENEFGLANRLNSTLQQTAIDPELLNAVVLQPFAANLNSEPATQFWAFWQGYRIPRQLIPGSQGMVSESLLVKAAVGLASLAVRHPAVGKVLRQFTIADDSPAIYNLFSRCRSFNHRYSEDLETILWKTADKAGESQSAELSLSAKAAQWLANDFPSLAKVESQVPIYQRSMWSLKSNSNLPADLAAESFRYAECCSLLTTLLNQLAKEIPVSVHRLTEALQTLKLLTGASSKWPQAIDAGVEILEFARRNVGQTASKGSEKDLARQQMTEEIQQRVPELSHTLTQLPFAAKQQAEIYLLNSTLDKMQQLVCGENVLPYGNFDLNWILNVDLLRVDLGLLNANGECQSETADLQHQILTSVAENSLHTWNEIQQQVLSAQNITLATALHKLSWLWDTAQLQTWKQFLSGAKSAAVARETFVVDDTLREQDPSLTPTSKAETHPPVSGIEFTASDYSQLPDQVSDEEGDNDGWALDLF